MANTEYWLRGPIPDINAYLQPVGHALLQARDEIEDSLVDFNPEKLWDKPAGAASVAFHLQHLTGVLDRLFTYARGGQLNPSQFQYLSNEGKETDELNPADLYNAFSLQVDRSLEQLKKTPADAILEVRGVGRQQIPSNVLGLLFHAAEHTQRHTGQLLVTIKVVMNNSTSI